MAWDPSRTVPWKRLLRDWVMFAALMIVILLVVARDGLAGSLVGVAVSLPAYLVIAGVLAKFGYVRRTFAEQRAHADEQRAARQAAKAAREGRTVASAPRARPAPTRRTSTGPSQHPRRTAKARRR